jgi:uncharacterized protein (TIGR03086 family)
MPWGDTPAPFALNLIMADHATHAWDLTRATGITIEVAAAAADTALATTHASVSPEFRATGLYAAEQPAAEGASTLDRLAAFSGRSL